MIHEIGVELGKALAAKGCPFGVVDGPEIRTTTTGARERIVIEHDPSGDSFGPPHQRNTNPPTRLTRTIGVKLTIYAQSPSKGSTYWEHKRRAEHVLDLVLIALYGIAKTRASLFPFKSGKFVYAPDLDRSETPGSAIYELLFTVDRGVADRKWDGSIGPTATITAVAPDTGAGVIILNSTSVSDGSSTEPV